VRESGLPIKVAVTAGKSTRLGPYEAALKEAGIEAVRNPASLEGLNGLLLPGGSDINPARYDQARAVESEPPEDARDELEIKLLREALAADLPVLAICRGLQVFNVVRGGTLIQHLASVDVHRVKAHNEEPRRHPAAHRVWVAPSTRLAEIVGGSGGLDVNSRHHQAVESLGQGLIVSAVAIDGVIEAIEKPGAAFAVGVQWHPEDRIDVSEADRKLFEAFAAAMAQRKAECGAVADKR